METGGKEELQTCMTNEGCKSESLHEVFIQSSLKSDLVVWY